MGLYETAVDQLCSWTVRGKLVRPKVIASTATIKRAGDQVHALFLRKCEVFPPHGTDVEDNFFSITRPPSEKYPGRRYLGLCAFGKRLKAALIRSYVAEMGAAQKLYAQFGKHVDPWMTVVGYFNSLRELGGMRRLVDDDVTNRLQNVDARGLARRTNLRVEELTSRKASTDIPRILDLLEVAFDPANDLGRKSKDRKERDAAGPKPVDCLLATNMLSVGVDVRRLGLMTVGGQPKSTAEYIQATSRVGRAAPGLVCTVLNWARPRDLSHYERFEHYHATFYQHVEALSVTPFAARALDRGLSALLVSLVRLDTGVYNGNKDAETIVRTNPSVTMALRAISARAGNVCDRAVGDLTLAMLEPLLDHWLARASGKNTTARLGYQDERDGVTKALLQQPGLGPREPFTCLNSLRDVEPGIGLIMDSREIDAPDAVDPTTAAQSEVKP
jgi:hypothetical protein